MRHILPIALILFVYASLASCAHNYYVAVPTNVPLLTHKGDAKANVDLVYGSRTIFITGATGLNLSGSYAFSDKIGIMGSGAIMGYKDESEGEDTDKYTLNNFEIGVGYINTWINPSFLFEVFAGTGYIAQKHLYNYNSINRSLKARSVKYFLQPNIALKKKKFSLTFSPKLVLVNNYHVVHNFDPTSSEYLSFYKIYKIDQNSQVPYLEPTLDFTIGSNRAKFRLQVKRILALDKLSPNYTKTMFSLGVQLELDELFSDKEKEDEQQ